jgi:PAS domain S-box-containing protein
MHIRSGLILPLALCGVLLLVSFAIGLAGSPDSAAELVRLVCMFTGIAALSIGMIYSEFGVRKPLRDLIAEMRRDAPAEDVDSSNEIAQLRHVAQGIRVRLIELDASLSREQERCVAAERARRDAEERYSLSVDRANDGFWEQDLPSQSIRFSARWLGMLGYREGSLTGAAQWQSLLHPDDRDGILIRIANHIEGLTPHFEAEYRIRAADGHYRWILSRGTVLRHASGKPYRMIMMDNDVHARRLIEETLVQTAEGLSQVSGMDFFRALMSSLSGIIGTRDNLVCYCLDNPPTRVRTLAYYSNGQFWDNFDYELEGTSCGAVIARGEVVYVPSGVCDIWPVERQYDRDSYIGVPLYDSGARLIGHFACMDGKPMSQDMPHLAIFRIFAVRAAAELERMQLKQELDAARPLVSAAQPASRD